MEFDIVDLTAEAVPASQRGGTVTGQALAVGAVDTAAVAHGLEALRQDLTAHVTQGEEGGLRLDEVTFSLTVSAEGKVAFVAKGSAEASIAITFRRSAGSS